MLNVLLLFGLFFFSFSISSFLWLLTKDCCYPNIVLQLVFDCWNTQIIIFWFPIDFHGKQQYDITLIPTEDNFLRCCFWSLVVSGISGKFCDLPNAAVLQMELFTISRSLVSIRFCCLDKLQGKKDLFPQFLWDLLHLI